MGVVYVDVLVIINALIGWFVLRAAAALASLEMKPIRLCIGALAAGFSSLLILFNLSPPLALLLKVLCLAAIIFISFQISNARVFFKALLWYILLNMLLGGIASFAAQSGKVIYDNYSVYIYVPPLLLVFCTLLMYVIIQLAVWIFGRPQPDKTVIIALKAADFEMSGNALLDTGFAVSDPLTGNAVMLLCAPFPVYIDAYFKSGEISSGVRLLPISTASGSTLLPAVTASASIDKRKCRDITAAFTKEVFAGDFKAILNADTSVYF